MLERPTLRPRKDLLVHRLRMLRLAENHPAARAPQRLVRRGRHDLRMRYRRGIDAAGDEPREMRHVDDENRTHFVRDRAKHWEVDDPRVRAAAANDDARRFLLRDVAHQIVIDAPRVFTHRVRRRLEERAGEIDRRPMGEMAAMRQREAEQRVAELGDGEIRGHVRLRARMRLHIRMLGAEQLLRAIDRELLDLIDNLTAAVVALPRQAFGVLVRERRPHRLEHRDRDKVFARDQLETVLLPRDLTTNELRDLRIHFGQWRLTVGHGYRVPGIRYRATVDSFLNFFYPPLMPSALEVCFEPFMQDVETLFFRHKLCWQY